MKVDKKIFLIILVLAISIFATNIALAENIYVCSTCSYTALNFTAALALANNTDVNTIIINETGVYTINSTTTFNITDSGINGTIKINSSNVLFDCNGSTIDGEDDAGYGLIVVGANNVTIVNCTLRNYSVNYFVNYSANVSIQKSFSASGGGAGINVSDSVNNTLYMISSSGDAVGIFFMNANSSFILESNVTSSSSDGIYLVNSDNNMIDVMRVFNAGRYGINLGSGFYPSSDNNIIRGAFLNNSVEESIYIYSCNGTIVNDTNVSNSPDGAFLYRAHLSNFNNVVIDTITNNNGLYLEETRLSNFTNVKVSNTEYVGIAFRTSSDNNRIDGCSVINATTSGIEIENSVGNYIENSNITNSTANGIELVNANQTLLSNNLVIDSSQYGLYVGYGSSDNTFINNVFNNSDSSGVELDISSISSCNQNFSGEGNTFDGKIVHFIYGETSGTPYTPTGEVGWLGIVSSSDVTVSDFAVTGNMELAVLVCNTTNSRISNINITGAPQIGIEFFESDSNNVTNCRVNNTGVNGVYMYLSERNHFMANTITGNSQNGIYLNVSNNNTIDTSNNISTNTYYGINMINSNWTTIADNNINTNSIYGIMLNDAHNTTLRNNNFSLNTYKGIYLLNSHSNLLDDNTFIQNILGEVMLNLSNSNSVFNNTFTNILANADARGLYVVSSDSLTVYNNNFTTYYLEGLKLESSDSANITSNNFWNVKNVTLTDSDSNYVRANLINHSNTSGLALVSSSDSNTVEHNIIRYNGESGIVISTSNLNTINNNTLISNTLNGLKATSVNNTIIKNNTMDYNGDNGLELQNVSTSNITFNYIRYNLMGLSLDDVGASTCTGYNISYNDITNNTLYDMENLQGGTGATAENNWRGSTWAYYVDNRTYDYNEEPSVGEVDFCPLLSASFASGGTSTDCVYPSIEIDANQTTLAAQNFKVNGTATDWYFSSGTYRIVNASDSSVVWASGSLDSTGKNFSATYDAIYLPIGTWNITVNCTDQFGNNYSNISQLSSIYAIQPTINGESTASGTIGGDSITFEFNIITKGYNHTKFFMNLTNGAITFDSAFAHIGNDTNNLKNISGSIDYSMAETYNLTAINAGSVPSYALVSNGIFSENLTLYITPYEGLSAGTFTGNYGWGLFS